ncbi:MAG: DUF6680 family protein [Candidatus Acidiferrales bacterium]
MLLTDPAPAATYLGLKASEWIMIAAIIVGPILAVVTQFIWQRLRQRRDAKLWVFSTMMSLRATPASPEFVRAANSIDVVFFRSETVRTRWKKTLAYISSDEYKPENWTPQAFTNFKDLLAELLAEMAKDLRYEYDFTHFKNQAWLPRWIGEAEEENTRVRKGLLAALENRGSLNVRVVIDPPVAPPPAPPHVQQSG